MQLLQLPFLPSVAYLVMDDQSTAIGAIGAVLGYIGAEGATTSIFERLLWPQRAHAGFAWRHAFKLALLGPSGGPTYKAALQVLDNAFAFGLLRGSGLGHMLGTTFFPQSTSTYTLHSTDDQLECHTEPARNCLWERVASLLPAPTVPLRRSADSESASETAKALRAQVSVHHITLQISEFSSTRHILLDVANDGTRLSWRIVAGLFTSEITAIAFTVIVGAVWRSWLAVLWICPLLIKLVSACTAMDRESLILDGVQPQDQRPQDFEVHMPSETGAFLVLTGPAALILQFFRHFGHPKRDRFREIIQLGLVVASAILFPLGLLFSVTVMSESIQYFWVSYQMYLVLAMYVSRYLSLSSWSSTEEMIAEELARNPDAAWLWADKKKGKAVKAQLRTTLHGRYGEARTHTNVLLARHDVAQSTPVTPGSNATSQEKLLK